MAQVVGVSPATVLTRLSLEMRYRKNTPFAKGKFHGGIHATFIDRGPKTAKIHVCLKEMQEKLIG